MPHDLMSKLRRYGAGTAAILLIAGASACGGGSESAERGDGKMKSMLGGGERNESRDSGERGNGERGGTERGNGERGASENSGETVRMGSDSERAGADNFDRRVSIVNN